MSQVGKICKSVGCPNFSYENHGYCESHASLAPKYTFVKQQARNPIYWTAKWLRFRKKFIRKYPICAKCKRKPTKIVHHIKPARLFPELVFVESNCSPSCATCHNQESQREGVEGRRIINPWEEL